MSERREIKDKDAHNRQKIAEAIQNNAGIFFGVLVLVALVWGGSWTYGYYQDSQDREARVELYRLESKITKTGEDIFQAEVEKNRDKKDAPLPVIEKTPESFSKSYESLAKELEALIEQHKGKRSALVSALFLADMYSEYGMDERAQALLESTDTQSVGDAVVVGLVRTRLAGLKSSSGQCDAAVGIYEELAANKSFEFLMPQLLIRKVSCLIELGKSAEAQTEIDKLKAEYDKTEAGRMASVYERLLHLKSRSAE